MFYFFPSSFLFSFFLFDPRLFSLFFPPISVSFHDLAWQSSQAPHVRARARDPIDASPGAPISSVPGFSRILVTRRSSMGQALREGRVLAHLSFTDGLDSRKTRELTIRMGGRCRRCTLAREASRFSKTGLSLSTMGWRSPARPTERLYLRGSLFFLAHFYSPLHIFSSSLSYALVMWNAPRIRL